MPLQSSELCVVLCKFEALLKKNQQHFPSAQVIKLNAQHIVVYVSVEPMIWQAQMGDFSVA